MSDITDPVPGELPDDPPDAALDRRRGDRVIRRCEFITLLGATVAWPLAARAQQAGMPVIGFLSSLSASVTSKRIASFGHGLSETGYTAGRDVTVEARMAEGQYDRLPALAADLVDRRVSLIGALAPPAAFAAKAATTTIPIVFVGGLDPVKAGLVASLNRPGGNITGVTFIGASLGAKRLELVRELVPNVGVIALLTHPNSPDALEELQDLNTAAKAIGQELLVISATSDRDFEAAFASIIQHRAGALLIGQDPFLFQAGDQLVAMAARHRIPAIYGNSESVSAGALISYGRCAMGGHTPFSSACQISSAYPTSSRCMLGSSRPELTT